jgi:hypothetical protein
MSDDKIPTPVYTFFRHRDIEIEAGLVLAGTFVVNLPKDVKPKGKLRRMIDDIILGLVLAARAGLLGSEVVVWRDGRRPDNADAFVKSEEAKANWVNSHHSIAVYARSSDDGMPQIDNNLRRLLLDS